MIFLWLQRCLSEWKLSPYYVFVLVNSIQQINNLCLCIQITIFRLVTIMLSQNKISTTVYFKTISHPFWDFNKILILSPTQSSSQRNTFNDKLYINLPWDRAMCYSGMKTSVNWLASISTKLHLLYKINSYLLLSKIIDVLHIDDSQTTSVVINRQPIPFKFWGWNTWQYLTKHFSFQQEVLHFFPASHSNCIGSNASYRMMMVVTKEHPLLLKC